MQLSAIVTVVPDVSSVESSGPENGGGHGGHCGTASLRRTFQESKEIQKFSQKVTKFTKSKIKFQSFTIIQCLIRNFQFLSVPCTVSFVFWPQHFETA